MEPGRAWKREMRSWLEEVLEQIWVGAIAVCHREKGKCRRLGWYLVVWAGLWHRGRTYPSQYANMQSGWNTGGRVWWDQACGKDLSGDMMCTGGNLPRIHFSEGVLVVKWCRVVPDNLCEKTQMDSDLVWPDHTLPPRPTPPSASPLNLLLHHLHLSWNHEPPLTIASPGVTDDQVSL